MENKDILQLLGDIDLKDIPTDAEISDEIMKQEIDRLRSRDKDPFSGFNEKCKLITEDELKLTKEEVTTVAIRAYCPACGREIICGNPVIYNPCININACRYKCQCGKLMDLEYSYPRIAYVNNSGKTIDIK